MIESLLLLVYLFSNFFQVESQVQKANQICYNFSFSKDIVKKE